MVGEMDPKPARLFQFLAVRVEGRPPTPNEANRSMCRQKAWRDRREWRQIGHDAAHDARVEWEAKHGLRWKPLRRCVISVAFGVKDRRRRDIDNLIASMKPLLDGVVDAGIIIDDSIEVIQRIEFGAIVNGHTETVITVEDAEG